MLVDAVALLLGERADSGMVRPGAGRRSSRARSSCRTPPLRRRLEAPGLDAEDDRLVIRREVGATGAPAPG